MTEEVPAVRKRRTNAEILEAAKAERAAKAAKVKAARAGKLPPGQRVRRTRAQIEADKAAQQLRVELDAEQKAAHSTLPKSKRREVTVHFLTDGGVTDYENGKIFYRGETLTLREGTDAWELYVDRYGDFLFDKTTEDQYNTYNELRWAEGPWPFEGFNVERLQFEPDFTAEDGTPLKITLTPQELKALERANAQRR